MLNIVLVNPQIPPNTGNIARLCAAMRLKLHLIHPLGFSVEDRYLKRAGLDYWPHVDLEHHNSVDDLWEKNKEGRFYYLTTKATQPYTSVKFQKGDFLVFGAETTGLNKDILEPNWDRALTIVMPGQVRSLNLSSAVAMVAGEAMRQIESNENI
ncbi:MAG: hypothetical protein ACD_73C00006G0002 [uncultured bacterium]|nr:MAG: hypothetical protein ACD_73C00006G0002 [uncultured bacterium]